MSRALVAVAALGPLLAGCGGPALTPTGRYIVDVYDPQALSELAFRPPVHLVLAALVALASWRLARDVDAAPLARFSAFARAHAVVIAVALAAGCALACGLLARGPLAGIPHIQDERAYAFEARLMAAGRLTAPVPPPPLDRAMAVDFTVQDGGRWYGRFPPLWPALLALGELLHAPDLVNPLLTGLGLVALFLFLRGLNDPSAALLATALAAISPLVVFIGASYLSHPLALLLSLGALAGYRRALADDRRPPLAALLAWAACTGLLYLTRPPEGLVMGALPGLHLAFRARRDPRALASIAVAGLALGAVLSVNLAFNRALTGDAFTLPTLRFNPDDHPGFTATAGVYVPEGHNVARALHNVGFQFAATNDVLFGWPYLSLVPAAVALARCGFPGLFERAWLALALAYQALMFFWYSPGFGLGPRYHHALVPLLVWLSARGLIYLGSLRPGRAAVATLLTALYLTMIALTTHYPRRVEGLYAYWRVFPVTDLLEGRDPARTALVVPPVWVDGVQEAFASFEAVCTPWPGGSGLVAAREGPGVAAALARAFPGRDVLRVPPQALERRFNERSAAPVSLVPSPEIPR